MASTALYTSIKKKILILLILPIVFLPYTVFASNVGESLTIGMQSTKTLTIRPLDPQERDMLSVYNIVYESLFYIDDDYKPQGLLAESWDISSNGKTWTIKLRDNVTFSDGTPLTANDVVYTMNAILDRANDENSASPGFYSNLKYYVTSVSPSSDNTIVIKVKRPSYAFFYELLFPVLKASEIYSDSPVGTGPYVISNFVAGDYMQLEVNQNWWKLRPRTKSIMISFSNIAKDVLDDYEYARVDTAFSRSIAAAQYKSGTNAISMTYRTNQLECLLMNNNSNELTSNAREAIRHTVDVDKLISSFYSGMALRTYTPMYPGNWTYNDGLAGYFNKDLNEASRLLAEDGWEDSDENGVLDKIGSKGTLVNFHLRFYVYEEPDNDVRVNVANTIADQLAEIGIECKVETMSMAQIKEKLAAGSYDLALVSYAMDPAPDPGFLLMRKNTGNYARYSSAQMDELHNTLRKTTDFAEYQSLLMEIQKLFVKDNPFLCLYYRTGSVLSRYMYTTVRDVREYELLRGIENMN